jgi:hypothetical protein
VVGLALLVASLTLPLLAFLSLGPPRVWSAPRGSMFASLAAVLVINDLDAVLNPTFLPFVVAAAGGLAGAGRVVPWLGSLVRGKKGGAGRATPG